MSGVQPGKWYREHTVEELADELRSQDKTIEGLEMQLSVAEFDVDRLTDMLTKMVDSVRALNDVPLGLLADSIKAIVEIANDVVKLGEVSDG